MFPLLILALVASAIAAYLIVLTGPLHAFASADCPSGGIQKHHARPVPRVGGVGVAAAVVVATSGAIGAGLVESDPAWLLLVAVTPAFVGGLVEDLTKRVGPLPRLLLTMASGAIAFFAVQAQLPRVDIPLIDGLFAYWGISLLFTVFAVGGVAHSINIVDGFNGLASGIAAIALSGIAIVAFAVGDSYVGTMAAISAAACIGFMALNYPGGRLFLGDCGAYLLGALLGILSVLLVARNPGVSAWFPFVLLVHPVFETVFSAWRRIVIRGVSPGEPDKLHLHSLYFRRVVRRMSAFDRDSVRRNAAVAPFFWVANGLLAVVAVTYADRAGVLAAIALLSVVGYLWLYRRLVSGAVGRRIAQRA